MSINILPPEVASQIAAGEVVERPASVVKELLENSIDAKASHISIRVMGAGRKTIEVSDNGNGIPAEELSKALERHATSKLSEASDLLNITTLGFRGEALSSIGSVARLTITSRTNNKNIGAQLQVDGGYANTVKPVGTPVGTIVRVEDLFFNVPARLKFLKHDTTERRLIDKLVARYAFVYPDVRFQLKQENRLSFQTSGNGDEREVLGVIYGTEVARQMLEVLSEEELLKVKGFISPTNLSRSNRREIIFFVNGRPVQDPALSAATIKAYHTLLMVGRYPISILSLDLPAEKVDVNVHPTKAEVRFSDPGSIFSGVRNAVKRALLAHGSVPGIDIPPRWAVENNWGQPERQTDAAWIWNLDKHRQQDESPIQEAGSQTSQPTDQFPSQTDLPTKRVPLLRPVGQIAQSYLVAEGPDGLYLIDQHAAHERILFEQFMSQRNETISSQILLQPVTVEFSPDDARLLEEQLHILSKLGFQVEAFGQNTFLVRALPILLTGSDPITALRVLVEDFEEDETPLQSELEARIIARVCKRAAIKAGQNLSPEEQRALILDLEACQSPRTCPHGRPTMIHLSVDILERQFGRKGAR